MLELIQITIEKLVRVVKTAQTHNGSFRYCYESGLMTDAYMILLLRTLMIHDEDLIRLLAQRIIRLQAENGSWKLFHDEETGNLSATLDAYYALLASGLFEKKSEQMISAKQLIIKNGGISQSSMMTQAIFAMTGQMAWPPYFRFPLEFILIPKYVPLNFFDFVGFARVHILPVIITSSRKFTVQSQRLPDLTDLQAGIMPNENSRDSIRSLSNLMQEVVQGIQNFPKIIQNFPKKIYEQAVEQATSFILKRIEKNGTFYGYASSTYLLVYAWLALGYTREHPLIRNAIHGLKSFLFQNDTFIHLQNTTSTVWDTALLSYVLQEAGISSKEPFIKRANEYILSRQQTGFGDWRLRNPDTAPGGWGFSDINTFNPDVDDTGAALRAIQKLASGQPKAQKAWEKGIDWVVSMQNHDGGWPAFEKNTDNPVFGAIAIDGSKSILTDPSTVDITGRMLEFLGANGYDVKNKFVEKAADWLMQQQESNGSWYGRWGICYIYGTWAAITGLLAVGLSPNHPVIQKGVDWLLRSQNADGGWGESCKSDQVKKYVGLGASTPSQTAWAIDALIAVFEQPIPAIRDGVHCLIKFTELSASDWRLQYPTGAGLPGSFYTNYHSYRYIWPLLALAHYKKRYHENVK